MDLESVCSYKITIVRDACGVFWGCGGPLSCGLIKKEDKVDKLALALYSSGIMEDWVILWGFFLVSLSINCQATTHFLF